MIDEKFQIKEEEGDEGEGDDEEGKDKEEGKEVEDDDAKIDSSSKVKKGLAMERAKSYNVELEEERA